MKVSFGFSYGCNFLTGAYKKNPTIFKVVVLAVLLFAAKAVYSWFKNPVGGPPGALPGPVRPLLGRAINGVRSIENIKRRLAHLPALDVPPGELYDVARNESGIRRQGGIPLTRNRCPAGELEEFWGVFLNPSREGNGYELCISPGRGFGAFIHEEIVDLMDQASTTLARGDCPEVVIRGFSKQMGAHPDPVITRDAFARWQQANR